MKLLSKDVLTACELVEAFTGFYYTRVGTYNECKKVLAENHVSLGKGYKLTEIPKLANKDGTYVIVEFNDEENFTEHEYRVILVPKNRVRDVKIRLSSTEFYSN